MEPIFLGKRAGLSPFAMVLATSFWTLLWGPIGLVLAAPLTLIIVVLGKYVPDLEFLNILLGDEPPLSPPYDMYQRLISGDVDNAVAQIAEFANPQQALDEVVFPALLLASTDARRGRLDRQMTNEIGATVSQIIETLWGESQVTSPTVLLVPVRSGLDSYAAKLAAGVLNLGPQRMARSISEASGLMAVGSLDAANTKDANRLVFVSLSGTSENVLDHLAKRVEQRIPAIGVVCLDLSDRSESKQNLIQRFTSLGAFMHADAGQEGEKLVANRRVDPALAREPIS